MTGVLVAALYADGHEVLLLHVAGRPLTSDWVLPRIEDCRGMNLKPVQQQGHSVALVAAKFQPNLPAKYDRVSWEHCKVAASNCVETNCRAAIAQLLSR